MTEQTLDTEKRKPGRPKLISTEDKGLDDTRVTVSKFLDAINLAKMEGAESIETTQEIIDHFNRSGLNGAPFFIFQGIKVYPIGKSEEIESSFESPLVRKTPKTIETAVDDNA